MAHGTTSKRQARLCQSEQGLAHIVRLGTSDLSLSTNYLWQTYPLILRGLPGPLCFLLRRKKRIFPITSGCKSCGYNYPAHYTAEFKSTLSSLTTMFANAEEDGLVSFWKENRLENKMKQVQESTREKENGTVIKTGATKYLSSSWTSTRRVLCPLLLIDSRFLWSGLATAQDQRRGENHWPKSGAGNCLSDA